MRPLWKDILAALWLGVLLPGIVLQACVVVSGRELELVPVEVEEPQTHLVALQQADGTLLDMPLEDYLTGVVLAEMPTAFEPEALKAQAVAARTYACKTMSGGKHSGGGLCTDSSCCQAYLTEEAYFAQGGTPEGFAKIAQAVEETEGQVLCYGGSLIEAVFFSCSGGTTEAAVAVWGTDYPYLQSVESPGEESSRHYTSTLHFTEEDFAQQLGRPLTGTAEDWFGNLVVTEGGGVQSLEIAGKAYSGVELRQLLGLPSTAFTLDLEGDIITITTRGYGHRVGLSQYGANAMAQSGSTYQEILLHYYPGTQLDIVP